MSNLPRDASLFVVGVRGTKPGRSRDFWVVELKVSDGTRIRKVRGLGATAEAAREAAWGQLNAARMAGGELNE